MFACVGAVACGSFAFVADCTFVEICNLFFSPCDRSWCVYPKVTPHVVSTRHRDTCISRSVVSSYLVGRTWNMSLGFASRTSISCVSNTRLVLCPRWLRAILIFEVTYVVSHVLAGLFMFNFREQSSSTYLCSQTQIGVFGSCSGVHCSEHPRKLSESERLGV